MTWVFSQIIFLSFFWFCLFEALFPRIPDFDHKTSWYVGYREHHNTHYFHTRPTAENASYLLRFQIRSSYRNTEHFVDGYPCYDSFNGLSTIIAFMLLGSTVWKFPTIIRLDQSAQKMLLLYGITKGRSGQEKQTSK